MYLSVLELLEFLAGELVPASVQMTNPRLSGRMAKIIECVPNFSEGKDPEVIEAIAAAVRATPGATLLDVDPGQSTNRTVYTFVGDPCSVVEAALAAARAAFTRIDMRGHKGV